VLVWRFYVTGWWWGGVGRGEQNVLRSLCIMPTFFFHFLKNSNFLGSFLHKSSFTFDKNPSRGRRTDTRGQPWRRRKALFASSAHAHKRKKKKSHLHVSAHTEPSSGWTQLCTYHIWHISPYITAYSLKITYYEHRVFGCYIQDCW